MNKSGNSRLILKHKTSQMSRRVTADKKIGTGYAMVTVNS